MHISSLKLWNFRKFGSQNELIVDKKLRAPDLEVNFKQGLNVLIGENDSGKTAIIDAIKLLLKTHSVDWIRLADEDFYKESTKLRIECRFDDLSNEEAKNFTEWLGIEGSGETAKIYLRVILQATRNYERIFPFDIKAGADDEGTQLSAEAKEYLKVTYLRPLRDAKDELVPKKNSRLSQILQGHEVFKDQNHTHSLVTQVFKDFCEKVEGYFKIGGGAEPIKKELDRFLKQFFGEEMGSAFGTTDQKLKNILESLRLTLEDGKLGLGSHNLLFIASELLNLKRTNWDGARIGLIEELEAHLHPQAQLRVIEALQEEKTVQFILTTHSPNLASKVQLKNLVMCAVSTTKNSKVFPMGSDYTKLEIDDYKFLEKFLDVTKSNLFFAKGIILVEGWAEELLLSSIAKKIKVNLTEKGVSVVNVGGTSFLRYSKIYQRKEAPELNIPVSVITDADKPAGNDLQPAIDAKIALYSGQQVKTFVSPILTLEYCLFKSPSLSSKFQEIVKAVHSGSDFDINFETELLSKLSKKTLKKSDIAYHLAQAIEEDVRSSTPQISIDQNDTFIKYIISAIKYAARES